MNDEPGEWGVEWGEMKRPYGDDDDDANRVMEREWSESEVYWDSVSGRRLNPQKVREARETELEFIEGNPLYEIVDKSEAWEETGMGHGLMSTKEGGVSVKVGCKRIQERPY